MKAHKDTLLKPRAFHIIVQFVPLTLQPDRMSDLWEMVVVNSFDEGDISGKMDQLVTRCSPSQVCGHLILSFSSQILVNEALRDGLYICTRRCMPRNVRGNH